MAEALYAQRRIDQGFTYTIQGLASTDAHLRDILTLQYLALDHSKPWLRLTVALFYAVGFALLLWPTGQTFVQLIVAVLKH